MPFAVIFYRDILPVKTVIPDFDKDPFLPFILNVRKDDSIILFSRFKPNDFSCITIGDIPAMCTWIIDAERRSIFIIRQDNHILYCHSFKNPGKMPFAFN